MERYICIHGHFYQPPRENPWLEAVELQDSAYPYHDWNERITAECYAPQYRLAHPGRRGAHRPDRQQLCQDQLQLRPHAPGLAGRESARDVYEAILEADRESQEDFSGHGSALAQAYNHMIMPLANRRDKYTQVLWGIRDFEHRFGRQPEGMWLPGDGRGPGDAGHHGRAGHPVHHPLPPPGHAGAPIPGTQLERRERRANRPHQGLCARASVGPEINLFFYDGPISRAVAFEDLLSQRGELRPDGSSGAFSESATWPQLVHIATDGETYGHHHRFGDMALAYALHYIETNNLARLTNYGEYPGKASSRPTRWRFSRTPPGAAPTASSAGGATAAATAG